MAMIKLMEKKISDAGLVESLDTSIGEVTLQASESCGELIVTVQTPSRGAVVSFGKIPGEKSVGSVEMGSKFGFDPSESNAIASECVNFGKMIENLA